MSEDKHTTTYWVIGGNKWKKIIFSYEQALEASKTLINCSDCLNCTKCTDCTNCTNCYHCTDCHGSTYESYGISYSAKSKIKNSYAMSMKPWEEYEIDSESVYIGCLKVCSMITRMCNKICYNHEM